MNAYTIEDRAPRLYDLIVGDRRTHLNATDRDNILKYESEIKALTAMIESCNDADEKKILVKRRGIIRGTLSRKITYCSKSRPSVAAPAPVVECELAASISIEYDADVEGVDMSHVCKIAPSGLAWVIASDKIELAETRRHLEHDDCVDPSVVSRTIELIERRIARNEELLKRTTTPETPETAPISSVDDSIKMLQQCVEEMGASSVPAAKSSERVTNTGTRFEIVSDEDGDILTYRGKSAPINPAQCVELLALQKSMRDYAMIDTRKFVEFGRKLMRSLTELTNAETTQQGANAMTTAIKSQFLDSFKLNQPTSYTCTLTHDGKTANITFLQYQMLTNIRQSLEHAYMIGDNDAISMYENGLKSWLPTLALVA
jgi:hypothetical protein